MPLKLTYIFTTADFFNLLESNQQKIPFPKQHWRNLDNSESNPLVSSAFVLLRKKIDTSFSSKLFPLNIKAAHFTFDNHKIWTPKHRFILLTKFISYLNRSVFDYFTSFHFRSRSRVLAKFCSFGFDIAICPIIEASMCFATFQYRRNY